MFNNIFEKKKFLVIIFYHLLQSSIKFKLFNIDGEKMKNIKNVK